MKGEASIPKNSYSTRFSVIFRKEEGISLHTVMRMTPLLQFSLHLKMFYDLISKIPNSFKRKLELN